jgi:tetratricopeptide (TPR) repeat protein
VGISEITINYSRPAVKGREIWGKLVPYGMNNLGFGTAKESPWRAGADENTTISLSHDTTIEGKSLRSGTYGLHIAPLENGDATIIFSNNSTAWGSFFYNPDEDALRVNVKTKEIKTMEMLTFDFSAVSPNSTTVSLKWDTKEIPFKIEVPVNEIVLKNIREELQNAPGFTNQSWIQAANFALNNGGDLDEALNWVNASISGQFFSQKNANNLLVKSRILAKMGKQEESLKILDEASSMANINQLNGMGYQMLNQKQYDLALKFFKMNIKNNPTNANCYDSLGEAYKVMGDKENAIKNLKKALTLNPPANVKANSEKLLKELGVKI